MTAAAWQNLALAALAVFYVVQVALDLAWGNIFGNLGIDFASFWSAGYIADHLGFAKVYDLRAMQQVEQVLLPGTWRPDFVFHPIPAPYLAVFLVPFQVLALLPPISAFWIWTGLNLAALFLYLRFFVRRTIGEEPGWRLLALILVAAPVYLTLFDGQVNVWLAICVGEYLRSATQGKELRSGMWLGGLLLKPQCLIILGPALLMQRSVKALGGLAISSVVALILSVALSGAQGMLALARLWLGYAGGLPTNDIQLMMNWRMLGLLAGKVTSDRAGFMVAIVGAAATFFLAMYLWRRRLAAGTSEFPVAVLGSMAATGAVAWHSHVHMAMILIPPLVYLWAAREHGFRGKLEAWVFVGSGLYCLRLLLASTVYAGTLPAGLIGLIDSLTGLGLFGLNLYLLGWAIRESRASGDTVTPTVFHSSIQTRDRIN